MKKLIFLIFLFTGFSMATTQAQQQRAPSPASSITQRVGLTDITVEYSRPGVKDRTIFAADGLVPFGKIWRTGANTATKITISDGIKVGGQELAAGSYAILTIPTATEWTVNFYSYAESGWNSYVEKTPAASIKTQAVSMEGVNVESFTIDINNLRDHSAELLFIWDNTFVPVNIEVN